MAKLRSVLSGSALAAIYFATATLGLRMDAVSGFATLVWPPTGIAIATLVLAGPRLWPGVWLGAFAANAFTLGAPVPVAVGIAVGNTLEALLGATILRAGQPRHAALGSPLDVAFLAVAAAGATAVSASVGVGSLWLGGVIEGAAAATTWRAWWVGDAIGALVVAPLLLTWASGEHHTGRVREVSALAVTVACVCALVFQGPIDGESAFRQPYLLFVPMLWAAIRFGPRGASTAGFAVSVLAIAFTSWGGGPFGGRPLAESLLFLQVFVAFVALTFLAVGALSEQLERQRRALHDALQASQIAREEAERANALKSEFLSLVSHELRTPLASLRLRLERLRLTSDSPSQREGLERMLGPLSRLNTLIEGLLQHVRLQAGPLTVEREAVDLVLLAEECLEELRPEAETKGLSLHREGDAACVATTDRRLVRVIVTNLLGNAVKFTKAGRITLALRRADGRVRLAVSDQGPGIAPADRERIFEPFVQGGKVQEKHHAGVGLGLSLVRNVTRSLGGQLMLDSEPGHGSTFTVELPSEDEPEDPPSGAQTP